MLQNPSEFLLIFRFPDIIKQEIFFILVYKLEMKNLRKTLNLIALAVFLCQNFMTPFSYVFADEVGISSSELNSELRVSTDISEGGLSLKLGNDGGSTNWWADDIWWDEGDWWDSDSDLWDSDWDDSWESDTQEWNTQEPHPERFLKQLKQNLIILLDDTFRFEEEDILTSSFENKENSINEDQTPVDSSTKASEWHGDEQANTDSNNTSVLDNLFHETVGETVVSPSPVERKDNLEQTQKEWETAPTITDNEGDDEEEWDDEEDPLPDDEVKIQKEIEDARKNLNTTSITKSETFDELWMVVKVKALSWTFPKWTEPEITLVKWEEKENVQQQIIDDPDTDVTADAEMITFDIKFIYTLSNGSWVEVQPISWESVQVTFDYSKNKELKKVENDEEKEIQIIHINDKDEDWKKVAKWEEVVEKIEINEEKSDKVENWLVIDAESFSYYTIVVQIREEAPESNSTQTWQYGEDYFTINIARPSGLSSTDYPIEWFTIMDRNLWASISWTTCNTTNATWACGYLYQWWNNYWFPISANASSILTWVGLTWDESYNNNGYVSKKFVNGISFDGDVWSDSTHHDWLWWWANDVNYASTKNSNWLYWDDGWDRNLRQWPCPEWWHVPSVWEWSMLVDYWYYTNYTAHPSVSSHLYYFSDATKRQAFMDYFYIPFAGLRYDSDASLYDQGSYGNYWSSSPISASSDNARYLKLDSSSVSAGNDDNRANGRSVRCFKDSYVAPKTYTLEFDSQWGSAVADQEIEEGQTRSRPATDPTKTDYVFVNWYTSTDYDALFDFSVTPEDDAIAYAKWRYKDCAADQDYDDNNHLCYTKDTTYTVPVYYGIDPSHTYNWNNIWTITVKLDDGNTLTMMDMNLGATTSWTDSSAYWELYQRWNNAPIKTASTSTTKADYQNYRPWHSYSSSTFIYGSSMYDYWNSATIWTTSQQYFPGLWWWLSDAGTTTSVDTFWWWINNWDTRQWPCPDGYHVPSMWEWNALITYWYNTKNPSSTKSYTSLNSFNDSTFKTAFKLPLAGGRSSSNASLYNQGSDGNYWSSSPTSASSSNARLLYLYSSDVHANSNYYRAYGFSVRCFKDSYVAPQTYTLTFDSQDGTEVESQTVVEGQTRSRPAKPTKTDYVFVNWYLTGMETAFNFTTPATENLTVYAKWGLCGEWFVVKGNKCMPEWVELNWVIKISDWENEIWIRDRNVGATQPATMNKGQLLEDLLDHEMRMLAEQKWLRSWRSDNELVEYAIQKAKWIIWDDSINTLDDVYDYYYSYKRWEDEDYLAWFWNYYYRWNNDYVEFDQLFDSDWNVNLSEDFLNSWKFWDWETWWEDSSSNENPCDPSKWEYLPTPEDWKEVMDLWASITPDKQHEYSYYLNGSKWDYYFWENNWWWYEDWWAREFIRRDFMLPQAWYIYDGEYYNGISLWTSMNADGWVWYAWEWTLRYWYGEDAIDIWINLIASPIRCFVVVNRVTVTFDTNWWSKVESYNVSEWSIISAPATPTKAWYTLEWWYTDDGEKWDFENDTVEEDMTLYAKWRLCGEWFTVKGNKCVPNDMSMEWIIEVSDGVDTMYIRDRNVGAEISAWLDKASKINSLADWLCYSQDIAENADEISLQAAMLYDIYCPSEFYEQASQIIWYTVTTIDEINTFLDSYDPREDNEYKKSFWNYYFRWNNGYATYDEMNFNEYGYSTSISQDAIDRWFINGWKMNVKNTWWEEWKTNNPCDVTQWEYLPTAEDWVNLMSVWASLNGTSVRQAIMALGEVNWERQFDQRIYWDAVNFANDMLLPNAWGIDFSPPSDPCLADLETQGCGINEYDYNSSQLWTARDDLGSIWKYVIDNWEIYWNQSVHNNYAYPVRCFMVVNPVTVTFNTNWWSKVESYNVSEWSIISAPATPTKAWYTLEWWYTDDGEKWDFENDTVEEDMTLYAKWRLCGEWFTVKGNKCVPNDMSMEWIIEVSDGVDTMYIRDRNVGAEISAWLDKASKINSLADWLCYSQDIAENADEISLQAAMLYDIYCPSEFYEQASQIIWYTVTTIDEINTFLDSYEYKKSFWNYYFWWNNNGVNYAELVIDEDSWEIANMPDLDPKFLEWWKLWNAEWNWWIEWQTQNNPCDPEKWEYLPTPEDWKNLMKIRWNVNEYELVDYLENDDEYPYYGYYFDIMDDDWWSKWYSDLLFPQWWYIYQSICWDEELCYRWGDWSSLWTSQDKEWNVGVFDDGWLWYTNYNIVRDDWWNWWNTASMPVRCFINVPDVLIITLESDGRVYNELNVVKWDKLWEPTAPSKSSATFDGWYTSDGERYDFNTPFTQDIVLYAHWTENKTSSSGYSGWGGSSSKPKEMHNAADDKEVKDTSKSDEKEESAQPSQWKTLDTNLTSKETFNAHQWAYSKWLTKYKNPSEARMDDPLNRSEMAKISSIFATEFLDKVPNEKKKELCSQYSDMWKVEDDMKFFITQACELWYMWYESNGVDTLDRFRPYTPVTVAEAATILSRIVWWNENAMNEKDWYKWHLYAAYNYGLIDNIKDPTTRSITRREAYLMLYRLMNFWE